MNRRDFIKGSALAAGAMSIGVQAADKRVIRAAVVGCGGRGTGGGGKPNGPQDFYRQGALGNLLNAAEMLRGQGVPVEVKPVAFADYFLEKAQFAAEKFGVGKENAYGGANGYKEIMKRSDVDVVILTTPLNFRPRHTMAAIEAGKHVFAEKGVAVDAPGVRLMIAAAKKAEEKKLTIVCGTQRRHQRGYLLQAKALKDGVISPIIGGEVYWNSAVPWVRERTPGQSNKDYLCNNWLNFTELSGDHICEQHVHNIDVANWFLGRYPKSVVAFGARMRRYSGNQYDFFSGDFDYGDGVHIHSLRRRRAHPLDVPPDRRMQERRARILPHRQGDHRRRAEREAARRHEGRAGRRLPGGERVRAGARGHAQVHPREGAVPERGRGVRDVHRMRHHDPHLRLHGPARDDERHHQEHELSVLRSHVHAHARGLREGRRRADAGAWRQPVRDSRRAVARTEEVVTENRK